MFNSERLPFSSYENIENNSLPFVFSTVRGAPMKSISTWHMALLHRTDVLSSMFVYSPANARAAEWPTEKQMSALKGIKGSKKIDSRVGCRATFFSASRREFSSRNFLISFSKKRIIAGSRVHLIGLSGLLKIAHAFIIGLTPKNLKFQGGSQ